MHNTIATLPDHLRRYVVEQNYEKYTPEDQAVWRYIMRRLKAFLMVHAHPLYSEGLEKTGITTEKIPKISDMNDMLQEFGWGAVPVSGFIPPAAFMEFQSLGILPIASDMRSLDHILYTPAPDIVHEAAGHAPILIDPDYAAYLKQYAEVARHALISKEDLDQYEAIRILSDVKESPSSTAEEIKAAEEKLEQVNAAISYTSEAGWLSRMNWWTAEYGLIGNVSAPKIYGAGLLSSVGESKACLGDKVKKIPLSVDCILQGYDITEQQPQLFVTPTFEHLQGVLEDLARLLAYRIGGVEGLKRAKRAETINTVQLDTGLQISGIVNRIELDEKENVCFLHFAGASQLSRKRKQLDGHGPDYHSHGYSTPLGAVEKFNKPLNQLSKTEYESLGIRLDSSIDLHYTSGVKVSGTVQSILLDEDRLDVVAFKDCTVIYKDETLFQPDWGIYDLSSGQSVKSVFAGPADRLTFSPDEDFVAQKVPQKDPSEEQMKVYSVFEKINSLRGSGEFAESDFDEALNRWENETSKNWLAGLELYEVGKSNDVSKEKLTPIEKSFHELNDPGVKECVSEGLLLVSHS